MGFSEEAKELFEMYEKINKQANSVKEYRCPECDDKRRFRKKGQFWICPECGAKIYRE